MGKKFFGVTLESPIVGINFGSIFFERVNSIESLQRSVAKGLYNSWLYQASDGGSNSGSSSWQSRCITRSTEHTLSLSLSGLASRRLTETPSTTNSYGIRPKSPTELFVKNDCTRETQIICCCDQYNVQKSVYRVTLPLLQSGDSKISYFQPGSSISSRVKEK